MWRGGFRFEHICSRLFRLAVPYWFGHGSVSTSRSSVGSRAGAPVWPGVPTHTTSPAPSTSHATCGFPALRAPICFTPKLMGPILLGRLSARRVALDRRYIKQPSSVVQPPPIPSFPAEALSFLSKSSEPPGRFSLRLDV